MTEENNIILVIRAITEAMCEVEGAEKSSANYFFYNALAAIEAIEAAGYKIVLKDANSYEMKLQERIAELEKEVAILSGCLRAQMS